MHVGDLYAVEARANYVLTSTLLVRRDLAGGDLRFWGGRGNFEDWACFASLARRGPVAYLDVETAWQHGDAGVRLSTRDEVRSADARLRLLENVWGKDEAYLSVHREEYERLVTEQRLIRLRGLLRQGRAREARQALAEGTGAPRSCRALAHLPGPLLRLMAGTRRGVRLLTGAERRSRRRWEEPDAPRPG
jgi:hypothetical protein